MRWKPAPTSVAALAVILFAFAAVAQQQKPNILVIMADDIGYWKPRSPAKKIYATPKSPPTASRGWQIGGNSSRFSQRQRQRKPPSGDLPLRRPRGTLFIATGHYSAVGTRPVAERAIAMSQ
jgi:hypothetical protein